MPPIADDTRSDISMFLRAQQAISIFFCATALSNVCALDLPGRENALRTVDEILREPGYLRASELHEAWQAYLNKTLSSDALATDLEVLVNEYAIISYLKDPKGPLAATFEAETRQLLNQFGNRTFKAWRLRSLTGKILLAESPKSLTEIDTSVTRREIGVRYVTIPISGTGFNFSFDAQWDVSRLPKFPLSQVQSEFFFIQTDSQGQILALTGENFLPEKVFRLISGGKFIAPEWGVFEGLRIVKGEAAGFYLYLCYPFAGYGFYAIRIALLILILVAICIAIIRFAQIRSAARYALENRSGAWLDAHYQQSLGINKEALGLSDKTLETVSEIKARDQEVFKKLGEHIRELNTNFSAQARQILETAKSEREQMPQPHPTPMSAAPVRALHRRPGIKPAKVISADMSSEVNIHIELDLPLKDERPLEASAKAGYLATLRNKARAAHRSLDEDFIRDEKIDNYEFVAAEPMPLPKAAPAKQNSDDAPADLSYVQKYRYTPKVATLPMETAKQKQPTLAMREDLSQAALLVSEEE